MYPDIIESIPFFGGPTAKIKSHHNVGGLPKKMNLKIVEPLKELFKDEVRLIGKKLKISSNLLNRHPFPDFLENHVKCKFERTIYSSQNGLMN